MGQKMICLECGSVLESKHRHDFQRCDCPNEAFVDGGKDYVRCGAVNPLKLVPLRSHPRYRFQVVRLGKDMLAPVQPNNLAGPYMDSIEEAFVKATRASREGYTGIVYFGLRGENFCDRRLGHFNPHDDQHIHIVWDRLIELLTGWDIPARIQDALQGDR